MLLYFSSTENIFPNKIKSELGSTSNLMLPAFCNTKPKGHTNWKATGVCVIERQGRGRQVDRSSCPCSLSTSLKISPCNFQEGAGCHLGLYSGQDVLHINLEIFIPANCLINFLRSVRSSSRTPEEKIDWRDSSWPDFASHPERKTGRKGDETGKRAFPSLCL